MREEQGIQEQDERVAAPLTGRALDLQARRKFAMAVIDQLHQDFAAMGKTRQAKPLLNELMNLAKESRARSELVA